MDVWPSIGVYVALIASVRSLSWLGEISVRDASNGSRLFHPDSSRVSISAGGTHEAGTAAR